ncbi:ATP-binding protein [Neobacillus muris]|uniref:ATP-binding protein n=1 Tax=Neobacillus muris TaxID=2941334 RepID=UPI00203ECE40|nr:ATP-binding protein [Neobacillus muris]
MRNAIEITIGGGDCLILASDNSGGIGMKAEDLVHVPYQTVAYYSFRTASMECIASGGKIISVVLHNFCGNEPWTELEEGIRAGLRELGLADVPITGSTESNFPLLQSAVGLVVIGKKACSDAKEIPDFDDMKLAVIGLPLVGDEVIEQKDHIASLSLFQEINLLGEVVTWPVGSKGVLHELNQIFPDQWIEEDNVVCDVNILKSSGPAACFIAAFSESQGENVRNLASDLFHPLTIMKE